MSRITAISLAAALLSTSPALADWHGHGGGYHGAYGGWHGGHDHGGCGWCWAAFGIGVLGLGAALARALLRPAASVLPAPGLLSTAWVCAWILSAALKSGMRQSARVRPQRLHPRQHRGHHGRQANRPHHRYA